ncbi:MAG: serine/threonine protein kinase [Leptolyngbya sp. SIO4C1]|nr:serine/threonine protein kinase [Leptolyngbya sp. SIO4C1]
MTDSNFGRQLAKRYKIMDTIGQGSMGRVYLAEDLLLGGVPVAVKFLSHALLNQKMRERFLREAMTCALLGQKSIHVVRVTDYGVTEDETPFYVMEYLEGESLGRAIQPQPLPVPRFLGLVRQICLGLQAAHNGIVLKNKVVPIIHRDIKPSNILVTLDPTLGELVKLLDFGIAKLMQSELDQTSSFMGTLAYASPEQMEGRELDIRSDIYSLGVVMYQMLSGYLPVRPETNTFGGWYKAHHEYPPLPLSKLDNTENVPKLLEDLIQSCLQKAREARPQTVGQIIDELKPLDSRFGTGFQVSQRISTTLSKLPLTKRARPSEVTTDSAEDRLCRLQLWPQNKPIAEIVFPHIITASHEKLLTLWVMLPKAQIQQRATNTRYNNFICTMSPHPMILWLTALYGGAMGARWLPCYLDLKQQQQQQLTWQLAEAGSYRLLFFAKESPHGCELVRQLNIAPAQRKLLKEWVTLGRTTPSVGPAQASKDLLKRELNQNLKTKILMNFESMYSESHPGGDLSLEF